MEGERRREMVMEREILQKVSNLWGSGIFLPSVGWKPYETIVSKKRNHQIPAPCISEQV